MKQEMMEKLPTSLENSEWDKLSETPFAGRKKATTIERNSNDISAEERIAKEKIKDLTARIAANTALKAIESVAGVNVAEQYKNRIPKGNDVSYGELKPIVDEINQVVKQDWVNKMTDLESYQPGDNYNFICQSINEPYRASEYLGNYASCSLLTDENHNTYSTGFGFIYAPEDIVAASGDDINLENRAANDDDVMRLQSIPTIDSVENILKQQSDKMKKNPANARRQYNEVGVRAGRPIGIFCLSSDMDESNPLSNYAQALKLQKLNPELKLAILSKNMDSNEKQSHSDTTDDWDDDLVW